MASSGSKAPRSAALRLNAPLALGAALARRGPMPALALAVSALTALGFTAFAVLVACRGGAPVHDVPLLASSALAWGGGILHAVGASIHALQRDRAEGIDHLFRSRSPYPSVTGYAAARVFGLAWASAVVLAAGVALTGAGALLFSSPGPGAIARTLQATIAAIVYVVAFALVMSPIAMALLGARTRLLGYLGLWLVLLVPEVLTSAMSSSTDAFPSEVTELCALPSALAALRASLAPDTTDLFRFLRALLALAVFATVAQFFVRREAILRAMRDARDERPDARGGVA